MVAPYQTKPGYLYIPCKRGDGVIAPEKPKQVRLFDGMCGGYIDPDDWTTPPVLSPYTQGETLWIEIKKTKTAKAWAANAGMPENANGTIEPNYRRMTNWVDFKALDPFVRAQCPDFLTKVWTHKLQMPVIKLDTIDALCIKDAQLINPTTKELIGDVGQITQGNYTIGPAAGDNYPTFGGAGGGYAALGNLTGALTFTLTGNITETAQATAVQNLNNFVFDNTSNTPHNGDPTQGWLIQCNFTGARYLSVQVELNGTVRIHELHIRWTGIANNANYAIAAENIAAGTIAFYIYNCLLDGNGRLGERAISLADNTPVVCIYNCVAWEWDGRGFALVVPNANNITENCAAYNNGLAGYGLLNTAQTVRNCTAYGNATDFLNKGNCTGRYNRSSDLSATGGWAAELGNTTGAVVANDVQSVVDNNAAFFDITAGGALDGGGEANAIAERVTCIRARTVPGPNGTSIGPAEIVTPAPSGRNTAVLHGSHIAIPRAGIGIY